jgi:hypothetical protein
VSHLLFTFYAFPKPRPFPQKRVSELMGDIYASPVRGTPVRMKGVITGRGVPGLIFSEDMMFQDKSGLMYLDYQHIVPGIGNPFFALTKVEGTLQSEVVSEGKSGDAYVVKVKGTMKIPADLIAQYPKAPEAPKLSTGLAPLVQETPFGTINWEEGFLTATGTGKYPKGKSGEQARLMAREAGKQEAYAHALEMVAAMRVNAESRARDLLKDETIAVRVKGLIQGARVVEEKDLQEKASYEVTLRVPLVGMKGINVVLLEASATIPPSTLPKEALEETIPEDAETGLVIDARGTGSKPAIVPEIVTEDGEVIYNPKDSDPAALAAMGAAAYAVGEKPADQSGEDETMDEGASIPDGITFVSAYGGSNGEEFTVAKAKGKAGKKRIAHRKRRLRQGKRPLNIKAASSSGSLKSTVVVSKADGEAIKGANQRGRFLKACKVVIVTDSMIGGFGGASVLLAARLGAARGLYANEAGLGTAGMA